MLTHRFPFISGGTLVAVLVALPLLSGGEGDPRARYGGYPHLQRAQSISTDLTLPLRQSEAWSEFEAVQGSGWIVAMNSDTGTPHRIFGLRGESLGAPQGEADAISQARSHLEASSELLQIEVSRLRLRTELSRRRTPSPTSSPATRRRRDRPSPPPWWGALGRKGGLAPPPAAPSRRRTRRP